MVPYCYLFLLSVFILWFSYYVSDIFCKFQVAERPPVGKELFIRFTASAFRKLLSIYVFSYFPFGFEGRMWDLVVSVPDHCLSFYFKRLGLPTLEYRRERADVVEVFKILNNIDLANKDKLFQMAIYRTTSGHPLKLLKRRSRLNLRANNFSLRVIDKWNATTRECCTGTLSRQF